MKLLYIKQGIYGIRHDPMIIVNFVKLQQKFGASIWIFEIPYKTVELQNEVHWTRNLN